MSHSLYNSNVSGFSTFDTQTCPVDTTLKTLTINFAKLDHIVNEGPYPHTLSRVIHEFIPLVDSSKAMVDANRKHLNDLVEYFSESRLNRIVTTLVSQSMGAAPTAETLQSICHLVFVVYRIPFEVRFRYRISDRVTVALLDQLNSLFSRSKSFDYRKDTLQISHVKRPHLIESLEHDIIDLTILTIVTFCYPSVSVLKFIYRLPLKSTTDIARTLDFLEGFSNCSHVCYSYHGILNPHNNEMKHLYSRIIDDIQHNMDALDMPDSVKLSSCIATHQDLFSGIQSSLPTVNRFPQHHQCISRTGHYKKFLQESEKFPQWASIFNSASENVSTYENDEIHEATYSTVHTYTPARKPGIRQRIRNFFAALWYRRILRFEKTI